MDPVNLSNPNNLQPSLSFSGSFGFVQHLPHSATMVPGGSNSGANFVPHPSIPFNHISAPMPLDARLVGNPQPLQHNGSSPAARERGAPAGQSGVQEKRGRGRPRKNQVDGNGNSPAPGGRGRRDSGEANGEASQGKKQPGRPRGSGKKQPDIFASLPRGSGFTPHVIGFQPNQNIAARMVDLAQEGPRTISIMSANGAVRSVTLRRPEAADGSGIASYQGHFDILSLSGSSRCVNDDRSRNDSFKLSVTLSTADGHFFGGVVAGELIADTEVQITLGSFLPNRRKSDGSGTRQLVSPAPHSLNNGCSVPPNAAPQLDNDSDSSDDDGGGQPSAAYDSHTMQMLQQHMSWANPGMGGMYPNT